MKLPPRAPVIHLEKHGSSRRREILERKLRHAANSTHTEPVRTPAGFRDVDFLQTASLSSYIGFTNRAVECNL